MKLRVELLNNDLKDILIAGMALTIVGLVFMLAFTTWLLETGNEAPARMFPLKLLSTMLIKYD